jgi:hypothetical protein
VHHDITLPAFPLSLAWLDCPPKAAGVFVCSCVRVFLSLSLPAPGIHYSHFLNDVGMNA